MFSTFQLIQVLRKFSKTFNRSQIQFSYYSLIVFSVLITKECEARQHLDNDMHPELKQDRS